MDDQRTDRAGSIKTAKTIAIASLSFLVGGVITMSVIGSLRRDYLWLLVTSLVILPIAIWTTRNKFPIR